MSGVRKERSVDASGFWKIVFPVLTLILLLFIIFVIFTIPDWALTDKCSADPGPLITRAIRSNAVKNA